MSKAFIVSLAVLLVMATIIYRGMIVRRDCRDLHALRTRVVLDQIATASHVYFLDCRTWPPSMANLISNAQGIVYLRDSISEPKDAWHNPIDYHPYDPKLGYGSVVSFGSDGKSGGWGRNSDIEVRFNQK